MTRAQAESVEWLRGHYEKVTTKHHGPVLVASCRRQGRGGRIEWDRWEIQVGGARRCVEPS